MAKSKGVKPAKPTPGGIVKKPKKSKGESEGKKKKDKKDPKASKPRKGTKRTRHSKKDESDDEAMDENDEDEEEENQEADPEEEEEEEEEEQAEQTEEQTAEAKEAREKKREKRARAVARTVGYRRMARKSGFTDGQSPKMPDRSHRDQTAHILSLAEIGRACRFAPQDNKHITYENAVEYGDRLRLSLEPMTRPVRATIRPTLESIARKTVNDAVQRTQEMGKTRITASTLYACIRQYDGLLRFSWASPLGLIRHAQVTTIGPKEKDQKGVWKFKSTATTALTATEDDEAAVSKEIANASKQLQTHKDVSEEMLKRFPKKAKKAKVVN